ncbi:peptidase M23-like protein [Williamsia limnetica]|jgi:murein DD-endopeptidase MepM/ murein hydrolase activator NlpD|uniref:Peptidase M23-like protein n=2 Tax=Williamsia limnetica TaxID=882452 RepID=A0A318RR02_WILLI|nr:peptidase M23-like protein [Williamsia limnetica]
MRHDEITSIIPIEDFGLEEYADGPLTEWRNESLTTSGRRRADRSGARRFDRDAYDQPRPAEITQDIVVAEIEFDEYAHEHPFQIHGAEFDDFEPESEEPLWTPQKQQSPRRGSGKHRIAAPPQALKGRAALLAVAAGAAVAAATGNFAQPAQDNPQPATPTPVAVTNGDTEGPAAGIAGAPVPANMDTFTSQLAEGQEIAAAKAQADAAARVPLFVSPIAPGAYTFTSTYANRWGSFHGGIDMAAPLGTPIHAATDGEVIDAGPASGYGNWVQIKSDDGTVTMYGHMASSGVLVTKGQKVTAGQIIALVGSEGFSTGPHLHFEVWKNGTMKIDPAPWLASHGISLASYTGS